MHNAQSQQYHQIAKAIRFLQTHQQSQPALTDIANHLGMSPAHCQRVFSAWVGISPKQFLQFLSKEHAKKLLTTQPVLDSALSTGYSSASRLHDVLVKYDAITPGEYKSQGQNLSIIYGHADSPFGQCFIAQTPRGVCALSFFDSAQELEQEINDLYNTWSLSHIEQNQLSSEKMISEIFSLHHNKKTFHALFKGTPFQIQVWQALLNIPRGKLCSYQHIAKTINKPTAARAVASAIAKNHIGFLIPCHRVIRGDGSYNNYRWKPERKTAMIIYENHT